MCSFLWILCLLLIFASLVVHQLYRVGIVLGLGLLASYKTSYIWAYLGDRYDMGKGNWFVLIVGFALGVAFGFVLAVVVRRC